jgi:hypothetical protein
MTPVLPTKSIRPSLTMGTGLRAARQGLLRIDDSGIVSSKLQLKRVSGEYSSR